MICVELEKILLPAVTTFYPLSYAVFTFCGAADSTLAPYAIFPPATRRVHDP
jgi:hypothetical protein